MFCSTTTLRLLNCITEATQVTEGRMLVSPALCYFSKTQTQCLLGRTENNHGTLIGTVGIRADTKH